MSEEEDHVPAERSELNKLLADLDIDLKLKAASQRGETELVKELLCNGAQVITDEVCLLRLKSYTCSCSGYTALVSTS